MNNYHDLSGDKMVPHDGRTNWKKLCSMEKKLLVVTSIALLIIFIIIVILAIYMSRPQAVCTAENCIEESSKLLDYINPKVGPCDDFYEFACGNFLDNSHLGEFDNVGVQFKIDQEMYNRFRYMLEESDGLNDPKSLRLARQFYRACINEAAIEKSGLNMINNVIMQIGGWPVIEGNNWRENEFDWKNATYKLRRQGFVFDFFVGVFIGVDPNEETNHILEVHSPFSPFHRISSREEEDWFYNHMVNLSVIFGADTNRANIELRDVLNFHRTVFSEYDSGGKTQVVTVAELQNTFPDIPWMDYINAVLSPTHVTSKTFVKLHDAPYFFRLQNFLRRTPKRVVANYIIWIMVLQASDYLTKAVTDLGWTRPVELNENAPRTLRCAYYTEAKFRMPLEAAYIRKYLQIGTKDDVTAMESSIRGHLKDVVRNMEWMDSETREKLIKKLSTMTTRIAYPSELVDTEKVDEPYSGVTIDENNFLASALNLNYHSTNEEFSKLHESVESEHESYATQTHSYYSPQDNTITIPAGMLQNPVYARNRPNYLNYGSLGSSIASSIFETILAERHSTEHGVGSTQTWLNFNEKLSCIGMHYGKYHLDEIGEYLNYTNTKDEDMANIAGVRLSYEAYIKWVASNSGDQKLPGLDEYTPKQLFWISSAVRYCEKVSPESMRFRLEHSTSSPNKFQVLGALRNSEAFTKDFECTEESYMNDKERCDVW